MRSDWKVKTIALVVAAAAAVPTIAVLAGDEAASEGLGFALFDTGTHGSELNVGVTANGDIFLGGWDRIARSSDEGNTWIHSSPRPIVNVAADRVLIVDKDTGRVFVDDTDLGCTILSWSDDLGASWLTNPIACGGGATDHQKIATGKRMIDVDTGVYENVVYVCANGLTHTPCAASFDGGLTFGPGMPSMQLDAQDPFASSTTCAFQGVPVANDAGVLYQPRTQCGAALWWSEDNGFTWTHSKIPVAASSDVADVAITSDGTVYFFFTSTDWQPHYVASQDGGRSWGTPIGVAAPGVQSALFPVITAGDDGRIALAYYGSENWGGNPGAAPASATWNLYSAIIEDAAGTPIIHQARLTSDADPIQRGCLSKLGSCLGNIADYIDIDLMPDGRAVIGYVDGCAACSGAAASVEDDGFVAIQTSGPKLR